MIQECAVGDVLTDASGQANNGVSEQATNGYKSEDHNSVLTAQTSASKDPTPKATQSTDIGHGLTGGGSSEQQVRYQLQAADKEHHQDITAKKAVNKHHMVGTYVPDTFINTSDFEEEAGSKAYQGTQPAPKGSIKMKLMLTKSQSNPLLLRKNQDAQERKTADPAASDSNLMEITLVKK